MLLYPTITVKLGVRCREQCKRTVLLEGAYHIGLLEGAYHIGLLEGAYHIGGLL